MLVLAAAVAFWAAAYFMLRGRFKRVQVYPLLLIVRAGIKLEPMGEGLARRVIRVLAFIGIFVTVYSAAIFFYNVGGLFVERYLGLDVGGVDASRGGVTPLIPGVTIPFSDLPYILFGIGIAALIHEMAHAYVARAEGFRVKDAGLAVVLFFLAAFVEPEEEELRRARLLSRMKVYSAGVAANIATFLVLSTIMASLVPFIGLGVGVQDVEENSPAHAAGLSPGMVIVEVNGTRVKTIGELGDLFDQLGVTDPGKSVTLEIVVLTKDGVRDRLYVFKPENQTRIGVIARQVYSNEVVGLVLDSIIFFSLILGIINAAPLGIPLPGGVILSDGGHMVRDLFERVAGSKGQAIGVGVSIAVFVMLLSLMTLTPITLRP